MPAIIPIQTGTINPALRNVDYILATITDPGTYMAVVYVESGGDTVNLDINQLRVGIKIIPGGTQRWVWFEGADTYVSTKKFFKTKAIPCNDHLVFNYAYQSTYALSKVIRWKIFKIC